MAKKKNGCITTLANIIWIILGGWFTALLWFLFGLILCITIIGIPFGKQCFKVAVLSFAPFGKNVDLHFTKHTVVNVIWAVLFGWELFLSYLVAAIANAITIIGIPNAIACLKFMKLSFAPFGATIR